MARRLVVEAVYHTGRRVPCEIVKYLHCAACSREKPAQMAMQHFARLAIGVTGDGDFQVWCVRHACNVARIELRAVEAGGAPRPAAEA